MSNNFKSALNFAGEANNFAKIAESSVGIVSAASTIMGHSVLPVPIPVIKFAAKAALESMKDTPENKEKWKQEAKHHNDFMRDLRSDIAASTAQRHSSERNNQMVEQKLMDRMHYMEYFQNKMQTISERLRDEVVLEDLVTAKAGEMVVSDKNARDQALSDEYSHQINLNKNYQERMNEVITKASMESFSSSNPSGHLKDARDVTQALFQNYMDESRLQPALDYADGIEQAAKEWHEKSQQAEQAEADRVSSMRSNPYYIDAKAMLYQPNPEFFG